nr:hypothetical protein [uncultured Pseudomonas sp.]
MTIENVMMTLNRIPDIKAVIDSGTDWKVLASFAATALVVILGAVVTISTFRKTIASQEKTTKSLAIKDSRQAWINDLRAACAEFVAAIMMLNAYRKDARDYNNYIITMVNEEASARVVMERDQIKRGFQASILILRAKILLLSNPSEALFLELIAAVEAAKDKADIIDSDVVGECDKIVNLTQKILKIEWDRTRRLE